MMSCIHPRQPLAVAIAAKASAWVMLACTTLTFFCLPVRSDAALIFLKGSDEPLHVRTIRESETTIVVGVPNASGTFTERILERRNIDQFIPTVSKDRLAKLDPAQPTLYRDYAEELAEKKIDPDARDAAIRLYLIAAHLEPEGLGRSALLGMVSLARSRAEERRFRAMAYLLDPKHDRRVVKEATSAATGGGSAEGRDDLLSALRSLRQGDRRVAQRMAQRPSVIAAFNHYAGNFSRDDFLTACDSADSLDNAMLARIIRYELEITGAKTSLDDSEEPDKSAGWSATLSSGNTVPAAALTLDSLTEYDPKASVYRDGKWVTP